MIKKLMKYKYKYFLTGSKVIVEPGASLIIGSNVKLKETTIYLTSGTHLEIDEHTEISNSSIYINSNNSKIEINSNCKINNIDLSIWSGSFNIGKNTILGDEKSPSKVTISVNGTCKIGEYNRIRCSILVRFGGILSIGDRNAINENTEIRCDEKVKIGDYNQISYNCDIWDTNTHCIYSAEKRRELTDKQYPDFGFEIEKPITSPIEIGNDCWIGKNCTLLKNTKIEDKCIIGYGTLISNKSIPENSKVFSKISLNIQTSKEL